LAEAIPFQRRYFCSGASLAFVLIRLKAAEAGEMGMDFGEMDTEMITSAVRIPEEPVTMLQYQQLHRRYCGLLASGGPVVQIAAERR
jgi:hypothetical protein